jgi:hypothetical protein
MIAPDDLPEPRLAESLQQLPTSIAPGRDLWPGVAGRLRPRRHPIARNVWLAGGLFAAAAALFLLIGTPATGSSALEAERAESREMQLVLNATSGPKSATARSLAHYLAILDAAIDETAAALRETPGDPALTDFLKTLERRRLDLLAQAARFAAES